MFIKVLTVLSLFFSFQSFGSKSYVPALKRATAQVSTKVELEQNVRQDLNQLFELFQKKKPVIAVVKNPINKPNLSIKTSSSL